MTKRSLIGWGQPAPWFTARTTRTEHFQFSSLGGRFVLLVFLGNRALPIAESFLQQATEKFQLPHQKKLVTFAVSGAAQDLEDEAVTHLFRPHQTFHDPDYRIAKMYRTAYDTDEGQIKFAGGWYILDPTLRVYAAGRLLEVDRLCKIITTLPAPEHHARKEGDEWAPVLMVPRVLSPEFCRQLIDIYQQGQPRESGFMRERDGRTVACRDTSFKRRQDVHIEDKDAKNQLNWALFYRLKPEIKKAFQFEATRIERYIVARYGEDDHGFFRAHRDNTTSGTAHRRFAVTINLNAEDFDGGELRFPEYGMRTYKAPTGGAIVFSCSLLHEALPVTKGERFATLPFLYDDAAANIRDANRDKIGRQQNAAKEAS